MRLRCLSPLVLNDRVDGRWRPTTWSGGVTASNLLHFLGCDHDIVDRTHKIDRAKDGTFSHLGLAATLDGEFVHQQSTTCQPIIPSTKLSALECRCSCVQGCTYRSGFGCRLDLRYSGPEAEGVVKWPRT